ncbi:MULTISPECIES: DUF305 domain-containing protein [Burkholderia]|uniref:DUF305 domain-containing protein n=1 Tax=Burkholderia TaxID=32008 RepID=UPI000BBCFBFF|nr:MULTISPECIES: DUF305 domain-containing protein [Burkholderia]ATF87392.1 DUF305 domain-containing protein [Burkholderia gladioli pv. gladioli]MBJ9659959.1 DUF305 domain-containing protein [Burkholderia gladioli]MBJ9711560.1 DUF305 domain-containing protein [Burkholderia gladioli]MBU9158747.1 DUF305 domain-containing protein [Burkholderia gladioli]MBU9169718.1 DUF305 domain-containing protein [Burkholderia gladioli]
MRAIPRPSSRRARRPGILAALGAVLLLAAGAAAAAGAPAQDERAFLAENDTAMSRMMDDMSIKPSGDVDRDFVAMMVPHHQGAIDMAQAELRYGHNEQLRRIAQEIVVEQQQEIVAMRLALGQPLPSAAPAPDQQRPATASSASSAASVPSQPSAAMSMHHHSSMSMNKESQ